MPKHNLFFLLAAAGLLVGGLAARGQNMQTLRELSAKVVAADEASTDTTQSLSQLKDFAATHTGVPVTVTLTASYNREVERVKAANAANAAASTPNQKVYADAQAACGGKGSSIVQAKCNQDYLAKHLTAAAPSVPPAPLPNVADYRRSYPAPFWTTDLAGSMLLGSVMCALAAIAGIIIHRMRNHV